MNELRLDLEGTILHLKIEDYTRFEDREKDSYDDYWCSVSIGASNDCINYSITDDEMLTSGEVDYLLNLFKALIKGEKLENNVIEFIEPNLNLEILPKDSEQELLVDLHINLWNGGALTANYISLCLDESDIKKFIEYLEFVSK